MLLALTSKLNMPDAAQFTKDFRSSAPAEGFIFGRALRSHGMLFWDLPRPSPFMARRLKGR
jgi:hypothetical protein